MTLYVSRGNLANNLGYNLKSDVYEMQLKKGEKKTITLMINAVEEIEGTMAVEYAEGLAITFLEWEGTSKVKAEIECIDDFYKSGIIQFYFCEDQNESSGSYCNVYYSVK